jgi:hypothetical protein
MGQADAEPSMVEEKVEKEPGGDQMNNSPGEYSSGVDIIVLKVINHKKNIKRPAKKLYRSPKLFENSWNSIGFGAPQFGETPSMSMGENFLWTPKE